MRTIPRLSAAVLVLGTASCAREGAECTSAPCGTAVVVASADAEALIPALTNRSPGIQLADLLFLKLADIGTGMNTFGDSGFVPVLASSWRFEDSLTISFAMDPRARWHDNVPVTAQDVAYTFEVYRDTLLGASAASVLGRIASVTARDSSTAVFRFTSHYPEQFYDAVYHMRILPRHVMDSVPRSAWRGHALARNPLGNGPYRLVRWSAGEAIEFAADTSFFLGRPGIGRVIFRVAPDFGAALNQMIAGEADFMEFVGSPDNADRVRATPTLRAVTYPAVAYIYIGFNLRDPQSAARPHPLFSNRELRRALSMAVDRQAVLRGVLRGDGDVLVGPITRSLWAFTDSIAQIPYDTARARAVLDSLGWQDTNGDGVRDRAGRKLEFELLVPTSSALRRLAAPLVRQQLQQVGVSMVIQELEYNTWNDRYKFRQFDAAIGSWSQDPTPASMFETWTSRGGLNFGSYSNPEFDRHVDQARAARSRADAATAYRDALTVIAADAPAVWLYEPRMVAAAHRRFENVTMRPDQWMATFWTWHVAPGQSIDRDRIAAR